MKRIALLAVAALLVHAPSVAFASAGGGVGGGFGGGGSGGHGSGESGYPPWQFWAVVAATLGFIWFLDSGPYVLKSLAVKRSLKRLACDHEEWDPARIEAHVRHVFMEVQNAWARRHLGSAHAHMSERLRSELTTRLDEMRQHHRRNVMSRVKFKHADAVGLVASTDPSRDRIWIWIDATLVDYIIDEPSGLLVDGCAEGPRRLREVWSFVRGGNGWVVDEINQRPHALVIPFLRQVVEDRSGV